MIEINSVRLYLPEAEFQRRVGPDATPLTQYIQRLAMETDNFWNGREEPQAGGMLIGVGVGLDRESRSWCEAVAGDLPTDVLKELEEQLDSISPLEVQNGPIAFGIEIRLAGRSGFEFPPFPKLWMEAASQAGSPITIPDGLFELIWPEGLTAGE